MKLRLKFRLKLQIFMLCSIALMLYACDVDLEQPIEQALLSNHPAIQKVILQLPKHELQIVYTQIDTLENDSVVFTTYDFQANDEQYFYPASTVKLPMAVLALEWIQEQPARHRIDFFEQPYTFENDSIDYQIKRDVELIFGISDNEAYNRLYEILGRDYVNSRLEQKGITPVRMAHRLSTANASNPERSPAGFINGLDTLWTASEMEQALQPLAIKRLQKGRGYMRSDTLIDNPMDFSLKNHFPLKAQHELLQRLFYPENFSKTETFNLNPQHLEHLKKSMQATPQKLGFTDTTHYDSYVKFFMFGDSKDPMPEDIQIYNKVGYAYGTLTDNAFIINKQKGVAFFLSATLLVNENGVFNDNEYEYETIGIPFLAQLGREIYQYEIFRKR